MGTNEKPLALVTVVAGVVLKRDDTYLLVQEKRPKAYGLWNLPAGRVDEGETFEEAALREAREETGFIVELGKKLPVLHTGIHHSVLHAYAATIAGGELAFPEDELLDARWFTLEEIRNMKDELRDVDFVLGSIEASL